MERNLILLKKFMKKYKNNIDLEVLKSTIIFKMIYIFLMILKDNQIKIEKY